MKNSGKPSTGRLFILIYEPMAHSTHTQNVCCRNIMITTQEIPLMGTIIVSPVEGPENAD